MTHIQLDLPYRHFDSQSRNYTAISCVKIKTNDSFRAQRERVRENEKIEHDFNWNG